MNAIIQKTNKLSGSVIVPGSKSHTIRGLVFALLAQGESVLKNALDSDDTRTAIKVCRGLGAKIKVEGGKIIVNNDGTLIASPLPSPPRQGEGNCINTGNSGITTRFILPVLGLRENFNEPIILDCGEQMRARPIKSLVDALNSLGMKIEFLKKPGCCPLLVKGKLVGGKAQVDGITSQYISALLMSLPLAENDSVIVVKNLHERPYVEMTLKWLDSFGIKYSHSLSSGIDSYKIKGKQTYKKFKQQIPGDFSSASYFLAAGALIGPKVELRGLDMGDAQGDKQLIKILKQMGASISVKNSSIVVKNLNTLKGIKIDANGIPDLVPTLAVIATKATGKTEILNVKQARIKETDRIHSMTEGLKKMGAKIEEKKDGMVVYQSNLKGAKVKGYNDHRTVMAFALAGVLAHGKTTITNAEAVDKTFPEFYKLMKGLGAKINLENNVVRALGLLKKQGTALHYTEQTNYMKHIILIGFKSAGKSAIGKELAKQIGRKFIDLDEEVERIFEQKNQMGLTCRQIMLKVGQEAFRQFEHKALKSVLQNSSGSIIALGGGTPMLKKNHKLILPNTVIHITAPKSIVYERIMVNGRPAFFSPDETPLKSFNRIWQERNSVYESLSSVKISNSGTIQHAVEKIKAIL